MLSDRHLMVAPYAVQTGKNKKIYLFKWQALKILHCIINSDNFRK